MQKKSEFDTYQGNLRFDNLNFKLAVLQCLIFEKKVFSPKYDFGDFENIEYEDEEIERYIDNAKQYFTYLKVPKDLAKHVTELQISAGDDIYFEIFPEWDGETELFQVNKISDREVSQFKKLKKISFWYMSDNVEELRKQLKKNRIRVELGQKNGTNRSINSSRKSIPWAVSLLCMLVVTLGVGGIAGTLFAKRYRKIDVTWSSEPADTSESEVQEETQPVNEPAATEEQAPTDGYDFNKGYEESQQRLKEQLKEIKEKVEQESGEGTSE